MRAGDKHASTQARKHAHAAEASVGAHEHVAELGLGRELREQGLQVGERCGCHPAAGRGQVRETTDTATTTAAATTTTATALLELLPLREHEGGTAGAEESGVALERREERPAQRLDGLVGGRRHRNLGGRRRRLLATAAQEAAQQPCRSAGVVVVLVPLLVLGVRRRPGEALKRLENGAVASAPTDVAVQVVLDLLLGQRGRVGVGEQAVHRHDEARRAVAALRAVARSERRLDGVVARAERADALAGRDGHAIAEEERAEARVDLRVGDGGLGNRPRCVRRRGRRGHDHHAGAAAALAAAELGAREPRVVTDGGHQRCGRVNAREGHLLAIDVHGHVGAARARAKRRRALLGQVGGSVRLGDGRHCEADDLAAEAARFLEIGLGGHGALVAVGVAEGQLVQLAVGDFADVVTHGLEAGLADGARDAAD